MSALDDYALDPPPRDELDDEQRVPVWGRCECGAYVRGAAYEEAPTVESVCLECDRWTVAMVCERPRCECGDAADVEVGGMARCAWCAEHPEVRCAAE